MNKSESKYFNTAVKMDEAFLKLLYKKEFEFITVKEICVEAGVNRSTFYLHYENIGDLLEETFTYIFNKFNEHFKDKSINAQKINTMPKEDLYLITPEYLFPWLTFIKENQKLFKTFLKRYHTLNIVNFYKQIFENIISPILTRNGVQKADQEYMFLFYVEGIIGIVKKWIKEECLRPIDEIANIIMECVKKYEN